MNPSEKAKSGLPPAPSQKPLFPSLEKKEEYIKRTDEYRRLLAEIDMPQLAYRGTVKAPDLYTEEEKQYVEEKLAESYWKRDQLDQEFELDPP
jgi:hypothetical protein